jgi:hypothetical protein
MMLAARSPALVGFDQRSEVKRALNQSEAQRVCYGENAGFPLYSAIVFAVLTPPEWVCRES